MAAMFLSEHMAVRAIVAMTETGGTARFLSRFRSSVPIYALSRHRGARRRMALMRDVFPIDFDSRGLATREAARDAVQALHDAGLLAAGDHIMFTSGDHMEHRGRSEEHTSELQSLMRNSYAVFCLKKNRPYTTQTNPHTNELQQHLHH